MTPFEEAVRDYPIGTKVDPVWSANYAWHEDPSDRVVCGYEKYRDSDDDPIICVALVSLVGATAGWFRPEELKRVVEK